VNSAAIRLRAPKRLDYVGSAIASICAGSDRRTTLPGTKIPVIRRRAMFTDVVASREFPTWWQFPIRIVLVALFVAYPAQALDAADEVEQPMLPDGAYGLFIGHSFFVPVAKAFDQIAIDAGFSTHKAEMVFASGARGAPGALWDSERQRQSIEDTLSSGQVQLFAMTAFGGVKSGFEDYQRWIDLALQHNPETRFLIASPWMAGGPRMDTERYEALIEKTGEQLFTVVGQLREAYADTEIVFLNYGKTASIMKAMFEAGELEDIDRLAGGRDALFADRAMGHGGPMLTQLSALYWLHELYGPDIDELPTLGYDEADVRRIVSLVDEFNGSYSF
jgi:hypothetical protein